MLVEADLDENKGKDVTEWVKAYCEPPTRIGAATIVLDHTGKAEGTRPGRHAVGSRGKRAKAKVQYALVSKERYDREKLGRIEVELTKNTLGAHLETRRAFNVGGDGDGHFIFEPIEMTAAKDSEWHDLRERIVEFLRTHTDEEFSQNQVKGRIRGPGASKLLSVLAEMSESESCP